MAQFTFNGTQEMIYVDYTYNGATLVAVPGQSYDLDAAPDALWTATTAPKATQPAPVADSAPATAPTDQTPSN